VVRHPDGELQIVRAVAQGPGLGQYRLEVESVTVIEWEIEACLHAR
jgi:hypothetical protein